MIGRDVRALGLLIAVLATLALAREASGWGTRQIAISKRSAPTVTAARALRDGQSIDINQATASDLALLPRIGPRLAARIVEARRQRGRFRSLSELDGIPGIGPETLHGIGPFLRVTP